jgi:hypothetical protein
MNRTGGESSYLASFFDSGEEGLFLSTASREYPSTGNGKGR